MQRGRGAVRGIQVTHLVPPARPCPVVMTDGYLCSSPRLRKAQRDDSLAHAPRYAMGGSRGACCGYPDGEWRKKRLSFSCDPKTSCRVGGSSSSR